MKETSEVIEVNVVKEVNVVIEVSAVIEVNVMNEVKGGRGERATEAKEEIGVTEDLLVVEEEGEEV